MIRSLVVVAVVVFTACTPIPDKPDANLGDGGPNPNPIDACSGGCAVNQRCDVATRTCRDGCNGACDGGTFCQRTGSAENFQCTPIVTMCGGQSCAEGEVACLGGACTCLGPARGTFDSCFGDPRFEGGGSICGPNGSCGNPREFQQCKLEAGSTPCADNRVCQPVFGQTLAVCTKNCTEDTECGRGEACSDVGCLPSGLFANQECAIQVDGGYLADGGGPVTVFRTVGVGSTCLRRGAMGAATEITPTGTCTYSFFYFADQGAYPFATCRPPGAAPENAECIVGEKRSTEQAVQCGTGLECAGMRSATKGLCLRTCNALTPSVTYPDPQPACGMNEACINLYRREDISREGALLGVCTRKCNIFDPAQSACPNYGTVPSVCVPTNIDGRVVVSSDGSGVCMPVREQTAALDMPCTEDDPFKGAACASGQVCAPAGFNVASTCTQVCDTSCTAKPDGGSVPARCATQVNSTCPSGKTCRAVTTTTGARVGFCQ